MFVGILLLIFIPLHILLRVGYLFFSLTKHWFNFLSDAVLSEFPFTSEHCFLIFSFVTQVATMRYIRTKSVRCISVQSQHSVIVLRREETFWSTVLLDL
ncbi:unnamed protein product [Hymenolepis diminuta]|uniref:Uncharacterized protein n=1 Tax=Hymenolepis diminuta TaxID=6216 RepID=A0A564XZY4_HYMDI|nr:unnamed protein product [Hymenolepis diminuta]